MNIIETVVGNIHDESWKAKLEGARIDPVTLDQWQAQKNRFRRKSEAGVELAVALERNTHLRDGDILAWDEAVRTAIVARVLLQDVLVIRLDPTLDHDREALIRICFELGHALGNQHWPAVVKGTTVYVPLTVDRQVMASVMNTHAFSGMTYDFIPGSGVIPYLAPHEARRLFGGADATPHSHVPGRRDAHSHPHTDLDAEGRAYTHTHDHDTNPTRGGAGGAPLDRRHEHPH